MSALVQRECHLCKAHITGDGHSHTGLVRDGEAVICDECYSAVSQRALGANRRLVSLAMACKDTRLIPGYQPLPLPPGISQQDVDMKRLAMYRHAKQYAQENGLEMEIMDSRVHSDADWQQWCFSYPMDNPNKLVILKWDFTKPWCKLKTNYELAMGNNEILSCHWCLYFRDSYLHTCMLQPLDICKQDFERFIVNTRAADGTAEECAICSHTKLSERFCSTCNNSVCQTCAKKIAETENKKCPFCRADFLTPEARQLLNNSMPSSRSGVPHPRAFPLRAQMTDETIADGCTDFYCNQWESIDSFMQQVADAVIATGQEHTVYIFDNDEVLEENKFCTASLRDDGRVRMEFNAANCM